MHLDKPIRRFPLQCNFSNSIFCTTCKKLVKNAREPQEPVRRVAESEGELCMHASLYSKVNKKIHQSLCLSWGFASVAASAATLRSLFPPPQICGSRINLSHSSIRFHVCAHLKTGLGGKSVLKYSLSPTCRSTFAHTHSEFHSIWSKLLCFVFE